MKVFRNFREKKNKDINEISAYTSVVLNTYMTMTYYHKTV